MPPHHAPRHGALRRATIAVAACGGSDPFAVNPATLNDTRTDDIGVFPLSSAAGALPTAVDLLLLTAVRPAVVTAGSAGRPVTAPNFDFAVDQAPDGTVRLVPSHVVVDLTTLAAAVGVQATFRTGFQTNAAPFDSIAEAPATGYRTDTTLAVTVGQTVLVQSQRNCGNGFLYSKLVVVSAPPGGPVVLRLRVNPNCTRRSLRPGRG